MKTSIPKTSLTQSLATVSGALAATVASSHAGSTLAQITLTGNKLTMSTNTLNADVTGDGINDINIVNAFAISRSAFSASVGAVINGGLVSASVNNNGYFWVDAAFAANGVGVATATGFETPKSIKYLNPISFTDARINGGATTQGYLEVNAFNTSKTSHTIELTRLVFNPNSTTMTTGGLSTFNTYNEFVAVPEPSSLGLLALGAGGLVARRRRQAA